MTKNLINIISRTDSYKTSHYLQYPPGLTDMYSYISPRASTYTDIPFFGAQAFIKTKLLDDPITAEDVKYQARRAKLHGVPFNYDGWMRVVNKWGGYAPIQIDAVPEGTITSPKNIQVRVTNLDPDLPWSTGQSEMSLLRAVWYPTTVAAVSRKMKSFIYQGLLQTSMNPDAELPFKLHDMGGRGVSSEESAMLGGMGHLVNFMGTDTYEAIEAAYEYYDEEMAGFSIPASEHSTITAWGREHEADAFLNMLTNHPTGMVACVSDSYNIYRATSQLWGTQLKEQVKARDGVLIVRPDSGSPTSMVLDVVDRLMECFGFSVNAKGFKVLPDYVRAMHSDGMTEETIPRLLQNSIDRGISIDNFAMGMGGGLLQKVDRDTLGYAMKASAAKVNGEWRDVYKDPVTAPDKKSLRGQMSLVNIPGQGQQTILTENLGMTGYEDMLRPIYRAGELLVDDSFATIRERAAL